MFTRWGALIYRFRRPVALLMVIVAIAAASLATQTSSVLSSGGWLDGTSESAEVSARLDTEFGAGKSAIVALFRADSPGADATSPAFQQAIATAVAGLADDPRVSGVVGYSDTGDRRFISRVGRASAVTCTAAAVSGAGGHGVDGVTAAGRGAASNSRQGAAGRRFGWLLASRYLIMLNPLKFLGFL